MGSIRGRVALVTGVGTPVGRATVLTFAEAGASIVAVDADPHLAEAACHEVRQVDGDAVAVTANLSSPGEARRAVAEGLEVYDRLDFAFNHTATRVPPGGLVELEWSDWRRVLEEDLTSVFLAMKHEAPAMRAGGGGVIVNSASLLALVGMASASALTAAHHGVLGLTKASALDLAPWGIRVNAVCSGLDPWTLPDHHGRRGPRGMVHDHPEEVAATVAWLCSSEAANVTGQAVPVGEASATPSAVAPVAPTATPDGFGRRARGR